MALFKKNNAETAPPENETGASPDANGAFDFDAIARDLEATNGSASPLDQLLAQPANSNAASQTDSATDDLDPLGFNSIPTAPTRPTPPRPLQIIPPVQPPASTPATTDDDDPLGFSQLISSPNPPLSPVAPPAPPLETPSATLPPVAPPPPSVPVPPAPLASAPVAPLPSTPSPASFLPSAYPSPTDAPVATKKKLPIVPIVGILALIGVAGVGAFYFVSGGRGNTEPPIPPAPTPAPLTSSSSPLNPRPGTAPSMRITTGEDGKVTVHGAQPTVPLTPALKTQLKALWKKGAAAKQAGDIKGARKYWQQALKLRPNHPGIQEAIDKLPVITTNR